MPPRRHILQLRCRLGVIAAVAAGYEVIWLWVMGVRPLCGRRVWGRCHPKLRSAYLGFSGVSPLHGFLRLCRWGVSFPQAALRLHAVMAVPQGYCSFAAGYGLVG